MNRALDYLVRALPFSALAWSRGELVHWRIWRWCWTRSGDVRYAQGPGLSYRAFPDLVATRVLRHIRYHRVGEIAYTSVCGLVVYRRVAGIRSFRPTFRVF